MNDKELRLLANDIRRGVIDSVHAAASGHPGGSLGTADIMTYLYFAEMNINPENPNDPDRDRFVLSKGHNAPALYSALAYRGYFPVEELLTLRKLGSRLQGHPSLGVTPGVDMSTGSLGQGVSAACGMALAGKISERGYRVYTLLGDGEIAEGQCWEAFLFAAHYNLDNLCVIIDVNGLQIDGKTSDVLNTAPVDKKLATFGFNAIEIDGNNFDELKQAFSEARNTKDKPSAIIARTIKGKSISFMENQAGWHGKAPNDDECAKAVAELNAEREGILNA
jgi:transketolase